MIGELLGALIGRAVDRSDGEGGPAGAAIGASTVWIAKKVMPVAIGFGLLYAGFRIIEHQYNKYNQEDGE